MVRKLKEYNILVDGRSHRVKLTKGDEESPLLVEVDEKTYDVKVQDEFNCGKPASIKVSGKLYKIELEEVNKSKPFQVKVNGRLYRVEYEASRRLCQETIETALSAAPRKSTSRLTEDRGVVTALMPGRVVTLKVNVGDSVKDGDALCVLEAMKMENEIVAPTAGVIKEVMVTEGASVSRGEPLMIIE
ncbi:MAG: hypothetical protein JSV57_01010 [Candidatus Bathyarchaeota archaeon]|nr:MAG: hypothetical protein JSV57_01010 [Candidatus Bathyarchaeota archaeon]